MAAHNEASIWVSSAPKVARNTPRSRCSSEKYQRCSNLSATACASFIASRASEVRFARCNASALSARNCGRDSTEPVARASLIPCTGGDVDRDFECQLYLKPPGAFDEAFERFPLHNRHRVKVTAP